MDPFIPFCGTPPAPSELPVRWMTEPALLAGLALALALGLILARDRGRLSLGWAVLALAFVSPLCAASMALFSARVAQHLLLTLVAAPLIAAALPRLIVPAWVTSVLFAALFWIWHAPVPYAATLRSDLVYWAMHLSLAGAAILLWSSLLHAPARAVLPAGFTAAQLTTYAMLLTLSPGAWHGWHELTAVPYGLTALQDQQLAGAVMWVAGGALFMVLVAWASFRFLRDTEEPVARSRPTA